MSNIVIRLRTYRREPPQIMLEAAAEIERQRLALERVAMFVERTIDSWGSASFLLEALDECNADLAPPVESKSEVVG